MSDKLEPEAVAELSALSDADLSAKYTELSNDYIEEYARIDELNTSELLALNALADEVTLYSDEISTRARLRTNLDTVALSLQADSEEEEPVEEAEEHEEDAEKVSEPSDETDEVEVKETETEVEDPEAASTPEEVPEEVEEDSTDDVESDLETSEEEVANNPEEDTVASATGQDLSNYASDVTSFAPMSPARIVSGTGITDMALGSELSVEALAKAMTKRLDALPRGAGSPTGEFNLATIFRPTSPQLTINSEDVEEAEEVLNFASKGDYIARTDDGALTAAGWCAPCEVDYHLPDYLDITGLFTQPSVTLARGCLNYFQALCFDRSELGFDYSCANVNADQWGTDANGVGNATAGTKPCELIPCPTPVQACLGVIGYCIKGSLITRRSFPESYALWLKHAFARWNVQNALRALNDIVAGSTAVAFPSPQVGATAPLLTALDLTARQVRQKIGNYRAPLEVVLPTWVHSVIRDDLARRLGVDLLHVPDARINAWFRERNVDVQWVNEWQNITDGSTAWPQTVQFLIYPRGGWVRGTKNIFTIDNLYDSTLLSNNQFMVRFHEEGYTQIKRTCDSRVVTVPICPSGETAGGLHIACDGTDAGATTNAPDGSETD